MDLNGIDQDTLKESISIGVKEAFDSFIQRQWECCQNDNWLETTIYNAVESAFYKAIQEGLIKK